MKRESKTNLVIIAIAFVVLQSCETVSSLSEKIYQGSVDTIDYVGSVFSENSGDVKESNQSDGENKILSAAPPEDQDENSSVKLSPSNNGSPRGLKNLTSAPIYSKIRPASSASSLEKDLFLNDP